MELELKCKYVTVFVIIITHSLYSIDVSCSSPSCVYVNLAPLFSELRQQ